MRLIDADKLSPTDKVITVKSTGEKCVYQRTDNAPTVEAIPKEWIKKFINNVDGNYLYPEIIEFALQDMIDEWEKENESDCGN